MPGLRDAGLCVSGWVPDAGSWEQRTFTRQGVKGPSEEGDLFRMAGGEWGRQGQGGALLKEHSGLDSPGSQ